MSFHPDLGQERSEGFPSRTRSGKVETTAEKEEGGAKAARRELNELQNPRGFARSLSPPPSEHVASVPTSCRGPPGQAVGGGVRETVALHLPKGKGQHGLRLSEWRGDRRCCGTQKHELRLA